MTVTDNLVLTTSWPGLVGGAPSTGSGPTIDVVNPSTGQTLACIAAFTADEVNNAVDAAANAATTWRFAPPSQRARVLLDIADIVDHNAVELAALESQNVGKPLAAASEEIAGVGDCLRFFAGAARCLEGKSAGEYLEGYTSLVRREPIGVAGLITAWNYPLMLAAWKIGAALAAGNTAVLKPARQTPLTTLRLGQLARDVVPKGVLNFVFGEGPVVGDTLVSHPEVGIVSMTGGTPTGRHVARTASTGLKRVHLELGGKAPVLVFDDADPEQVVRALQVGSFWNSGQDCGAAARVFVSAKLYDQVVDGLVRAAESLNVADPGADPNADMGPVAYQQHQAAVLAKIDRALEQGATLLTGGTSIGTQGFFVRPTVLTGVRNDHDLARAEVFGPVVDIQPFHDNDEAVKLANDTEYGLAASVFTRSVGRAHDVSRALNFGTVWVNDHMPMAVEMPWGGFGSSGYGKDQSIYSLEDYTQIKHVMINLAN